MAAATSVAAPATVAAEGGSVRVAEGSESAGITVTVTASASDGGHGAVTTGDAANAASSSEGPTTTAPSAADVQPSSLAASEEAAVAGAAVAAEASLAAGGASVAASSSKANAKAPPPVAAAQPVFALGKARGLAHVPNGYSLDLARACLRLVGQCAFRSRACAETVRRHAQPQPRSLGYLHLCCWWWDATRGVSFHG